MIIGVSTGLTIGLVIGLLISRLWPFGKRRKLSEISPEPVTFSNESDSLSNEFIDDSSTSVDIQAEILTTLSRIRAEEEFRQVKMPAWCDEKRIILCPSTRWERHAPEKDAINNCLRSWTRGKCVYFETGTIIIPAKNFEHLMADFLSENLYAIIKKYTEDACARVGLEAAKVYNHEDPENVNCTWCNFRSTLEPKQEKIMFFGQFYKELISYQLYNNSSIERIHDFKIQLYREMMERYSDLFLETPDFDRLTSNFEISHFSDMYLLHVKLAMQQWVSILNMLGANIQLPFPPVVNVPENSNYILNNTTQFFPPNDLTTEIFQI